MLENEVDDLSEVLSFYLQASESLDWHDANVPHVPTSTQWISVAQRSLRETRPIDRNQAL